MVDSQIQSICKRKVVKEDLGYMQHKSNLGLRVSYDFPVVGISQEEHASTTSS